MRHKKYILGILFILILFISAGCGSSDTNTEGNNSENMTKNALLEGFPQEVVPLYNSINISRCSFTVCFDNTYNLGRNFYALSYLSRENVDEVFEYYKSIMTEIDQDYVAADYFAGKIGEQKVFFLLSEAEEGTIVSVNIGLKEEEYAEKNLYFSDYPQGIIDIVEPNILIEQVYDKQKSNYEDKLIMRYVQKYTTTLSTEDIISFYTNKYQSQDEFFVDEDQYTTIFYKSRDYECEINISDGFDSSYRYVQTEIRKYE